MTTPHCKN